MARRRRQRRSAVSPAVVALLCVLGLIAAGWAVVAEIRRNPGPTAKPTQAAPVSSPRFEASALQPPAVEACAEAVERGDVDLARAHSTIADWVAHVQAQYDLDARPNSRAETDRIWARPRERGAAGRSGFQAANTEYQKARRKCFEMPVAEVAVEAAAAVASCRDISRQTDVVLLAARGAVGDRSSHLQAMRERKAGRLDPHHAGQLWSKLYKNAKINIDKFTKAEGAYQGHPQCGLPG